MPDNSPTHLISFAKRVTLQSVNQLPLKSESRMDFVHLLQLAIALLLSFSSFTTTALPLPTPHPASTNRLLSLATGKYVSITKSGRVHANGEANHKNPAKDATPLIFQRIINEEESHLRIGSVKYASKNWFIVITAEDTIRATVPSGGSDVLEEVSLADDGSIALRVVNYSDIVSAATNDGSGSLASDDSNLLMPEIVSDASETQCYIGFSSETGRAHCYDNVDNVNVRLHVIPVHA